MGRFNLLLIMVVSAILVLSACKKDEEPVNQSPTNIILQPDSIMEKQPAGTLVGTLKAVDPDNNSHIFNFSAGNGDADNNKFKITGNELYTEKEFDKAQVQELSIRVNATDGANAFAKPITVYVTEYVSNDPTLTSNMFKHNGRMPKEVGRYNGNTSPHLKITNVPAGTVEMALTMRDLDAGNSFHWAVWNIPPNKTFISKNEGWTGTGATVGDCTYGSGYVGPFPPSEHRYEFTIYFLDEKISAQKGHYASIPGMASDKTIAKVTLIGRYQ